MTEIYWHCSQCRSMVRVHEVGMDLREDSIQLGLTLECGHEIPERLRLERGN